jgi:hypothetical protein
VEVLGAVRIRDPWGQLVGRSVTLHGGLSFDGSNAMDLIAISAVVGYHAGSVRSAKIIGILR